MTKDEMTEFQRGYAQGQRDAEEARHELESALSRVLCPTCKGSGQGDAVSEYQLAPCLDCNGTGIVAAALDRVRADDARDTEPDTAKAIMEWLREREGWAPMAWSQIVERIEREVLKVKAGGTT